jgi:hypothetical protein
LLDYRSIIAALMSQMTHRQLEELADDIWKHVSDKPDTFAPMEVDFAQTLNDWCNSVITEGKDD